VPVQLRQPIVAGGIAVTRNTSEQQEMIAIVMAAAAGEATEEQLARISRLVVEDDELSMFVLQLLSQEAWLTWHGSQARATEERTIATQQMERVFMAAEQGDVSRTAAQRHALGDSIARAENGTRQEFIVERDVGCGAADKRTCCSCDFRRAVVRHRRSAGPGAYWIGGPRPAPLSENFAARESAGEERGVSLASYEARLMHGTACVWGPEMRSRLSSDDNLRSGDALNLIEGLAELELSWPTRGSATLRLEGPAGLVLMADGGANLNYGKLTANVDLQYDNFALETPSAALSSPMTPASGSRRRRARWRFTYSKAKRRLSRLGPRAREPWINSSFVPGDRFDWRPPRPGP
jgi:hypothetical protein